MKVSKIRIMAGIAFAGSMVFGLASCGASDAGFPPIGKPPAFDYADGDELRSTMHRLAFELKQLDLAMIGEDYRDTMFQQQIVNHLDNIERIGADLRQGDLASRHQFLLGGMTDFLNNVERARMHAESNSPRYFLAGRVSGNCVNCHDTVRQASFIPSIPEVMFV